METKKNPRVDLERKKRLFFEIGLAISLLLTLVAFKYKKYEKPTRTNLTAQAVNYTDEVVEITRQKQPELPKPAPTTKMEIVDDNVDTPDDPKIDVEVNPNQPTETFVVPQPKDDEPQIPDQEIFVFVEEQPEFPGGEEALMNYLASNLRYPEQAKELDIQGTVIIEFVVETDGSVTNVVVKRGIGGGCDEEAVRVVKSMPKWKPGKQRGKPVRARYNLPVRFQLK
jgi:protein TonB